MADHIDVFVSSTSRDLGAYRAKLRDLILSMGMYPIGMENFNPTDQNAVQKCYDEMQTAEIFVGVYAHRYGYCPGPASTYSGGAPDGQTSITHMEYLWAVERKLPLLLFIVEDGQPWSPPDIEGEPNKTRLEQFKALVKGLHTVVFFTTPDNLAVKVSTALHETVERLGLKVQLESWRVLHAPPPPPYFAGRADDVAAIRELLKTLGARVVIQGTGGMGKTVLAKYLGQLLAPDYPAGVLWAFLGPQATSVELTCATAWADWKQAAPGGRAAEMKDMNAATMKRWLGEAPGPLLVILDDIWHDAPLRALLDSLPDTAVVLSTTRDAAHITPKVGKRYALKHLTPADALMMLQGRLDASGEHTADLNEIARLLGCHALALDLAVAYLETRSIHDTEKLIRRLNRHLGGENPFADLNLGSDRDNNLEAALALSYEPLPDDLKRAFRLLGAIPSSLDFGAPMAFAVWGVDKANEESLETAEDRLDTLARAALVDRTETGRYLLHGNLNAYAVALMKRQPENELDPAQERYGTEVLRVIGQFEKLPPEQWDTQMGPDYPHIHQRGNRLADDLENWLKTQGAPTLEALTEPTPSGNLSPEQVEAGWNLLQTGLYFAGSGVNQYVHRRSVGAEGRRWLRLGLLGARALGESAREPFFLNEIGAVYADLGDKRQALDYYAQALPLIRAMGDRGREATILSNLGSVYDDLGDKRQALDYFAQALPLCRAVGDQGGEATTLNNLGSVYDDLEDKRQALDYFAQALTLRRAVGDRRGEAVTLNNLGTVYDDLGDKRQALDYFAQALTLRRAVGDRGGEATTLNNLGSVYDDLGDKHQALDYFAQALPLCRAVGNRREEAATCFNIGMIYREEGDLERAIEYVVPCVELEEQIEDPHLESDRTMLGELKQLRDGGNNTPQDIPPSSPG